MLRSSSQTEKPRAPQAGLLWAPGFVGDHRGFLPRPSLLGDMVGAAVTRRLVRPKGEFFVDRACLVNQLWPNHFYGSAAAVQDVFRSNT